MNERASASEDGAPFMLSTMVPLVVVVSAVVVNVMVVEAGKDVEEGRDVEAGEEVEVRLRLKEIAVLMGRLEDA